MFRARRHVAWGGIIRGSVDHPLHNSAYGLGPSITWTPAWKPKHSHNCHLRCRLGKCCKHSEEARINPRRRFSGSDIFGEFVLCENTVRSLLHNMNQTKAQLDMVEDKKKLFFGTNMNLPTGQYFRNCHPNFCHLWKMLFQCHLAQ